MDDKRDSRTFDLAECFPSTPPRYSSFMDSERSVEIPNLQSISGLYQEGEQRLRSIIFNVSTSPEIRRQVQTKLGEVLRDIEADSDELVKIEAGH